MLRRTERSVGSWLGIENFDFPGTFRLLNLTPEPPDILHCNNLHGGYFDLRALPWLSHQVPLVLNLHDAWLLGGHCAQSFDCQKWKTGCGNCPDLSTYSRIRRDASAYNWRRKRDIFARSRLYVATVSHWLMHMVKQSALTGAAYRVIPNGVDLSVFGPGDQNAARASLDLPQDCRIALYAAHGGSRSRWRDFRALEMTMLRVAAGYEGNVLLVCVGDATRQSKQVSSRLRIEFREFERSRERMAQYYRAADLYVLPALAESFGKTVTEAMACGTPVIATAIGGIPEQVEEGRTGFLFPTQDTEGMAVAMQHLLGSEELRRKMGDNAVRHAKRHFDLERQVDDLLGWYGEIREDWLTWRSCAASR